MKQYTRELQELFKRIPRRHSAENVKDINTIVNDYENILKEIESINNYYEAKAADLFPELDNIRAKIKMSTDNKASKKNKDIFFDDASGALKDSIASLIGIYDEGSKAG
jgi:hypothetical protein